MTCEAFSEDAKRRIRVQTRVAIMAGAITRPDHCERCGNRPRTADGRHPIQAHHDDYSRPLDVKWLCTKCHAKRHRELGWGIGGNVTAEIRRGRKQPEIDARHSAYQRGELQLTAK